MKKTNRYRDKIICVFFSLFLLLILEFASRIIFPYQGRMQEILQVLKQDSGLFWSQKSNLDIIFQDVRVKTNSLGLRAKEFNKEKLKSTIRIICLGASPTFGWGVNQEQAYPQRNQMHRKYEELCCIFL